jgi:hypothetical protein
VDQLVRRGAVGDSVVAAGSVIANQPRLLAALSARVAASHPSLGVVLLEDAPVAGGVELARRLAASADRDGGGTGAGIATAVATATASGIAAGTV